ncbi:MAG: potassium/hydrogen antiporter [Nocardioidaceae bacterium]|jgi:cell volume regulation protein A|nr:potassium/hydrogen antiporter [Nocardioidaceae bacterium]
MDADALDALLLVGSVVLLLAILAVRVTLAAGLPSLLIYLGMGLALGESGFGIRFDDAALAQALGFVALVVILIDGGISTKWSHVRPSMTIGLLLATLGVGVSVTVVAVFAHVLLGMAWPLAWLVGAVTSPTDAAAVFTVLRRIQLRPHLSGALEAESGLNDAATVLLVVLLTDNGGAAYGAWGFLGLAVYELVMGLVLGYLVGRAGAWLLRRVALPASGLYPVSVMTIAIMSYAGTVALHASGFAAVYVTALVLGNSDLPHRTSTRSFAEGLGWLAQIGLFIMLGLLASPSHFRVHQVIAGLVVGVVLTLLARPLSVLVCAIPLRMSLAEQGFLSVAGLRGAVPIVLATIPLEAGVPHAADLFDLVFVLVIVLTLVQAPALPRIASLLGVIVERPRDVEVEAAPLERIAADLLQIRVTAKSRLHGVEISELRLPTGTSVSLIVRDGQSFTPSLTTSIKRGDDLLVVTRRADRGATERRLQAVSRGGRLAGWAARHGGS